MPFALLSIQIKQAVFVGQKQLQPRSPVGASPWVRPPPGSPTAWSPAQDVERWIPTPVCVCVCGFPPEAVLHQAPPVVYSVYSSAPQLAFITLARSCAWTGTWAGGGCTRGVRGEGSSTLPSDCPVCLHILPSGQAD